MSRYDKAADALASLKATVKALESGLRRLERVAGEIRGERAEYLERVASDLAPIVGELGFAVDRGIDDLPEEEQD